tara:strand:- start:1446 stop:2138 length:693 start_codon:yes stop_codon:yes gene_type:complete
MEIIKQIIFFIIITPIILFSKQYEYEVSILGVNCAEIYINYIDTLYNNQEAIKIEYKTKTKKAIEYFFFVENTYTSIINKYNYDVLSFSKKTKQPNITNNINTYYRNDSLLYNNNQNYNNQYYNIFSLLHFLQMNNNNDSFKSLDFLEREGKIYDMVLIKKASLNQTKYKLSLNINNDLSNNAIIENTDIFTWGVFLPNAKREIIINTYEQIITKCQFSIGLINVKATLK